MKKTSETKRSVEKHQASLSRIGKEVSESQLCELTSRLAVKSTMKRANSPAIWLSERQRMIKRARSEEVGSRKHFDGVPKISFPSLTCSDKLWTFERASWNRFRQALPTGQEKLNTQCHSESSSSFRDCFQQKRQARLWVSDSRRPGKDFQRGWCAFTRPKSPIPLRNLMRERKDAIKKL